MFRLKIGYLISGIATGCILLASFIWFFPDGKLHIIFCNVGQGDSTYVRFPDGRDMLIDGGPNDAVLGCLGKHMPFWDRHIDIIALTHPQKDHLQGLISVFERYQVDYVMRSDVASDTEGFQKLEEVVKAKRVPVKFVVSGDRVEIDQASLTLLWPSDAQIAKGNPTSSVLGASTATELNDYSLVFFLRYGSFDALFPGDADSHVEQQYVGTPLIDDQVELVKVPHHGSKTGMTSDFVHWLAPKLAVISVGKNSYGHPSKEAIELLSSVGARILRTDQTGDIEIVSDGRDWKISP